MCANQPSKHVLIVDRDAAAIEPLRARLSDAGYSISTVCDCAAAAIVAAARPPQLLIIDWSSSRFSALDLIQSLRRLRAPAAPGLIIVSPPAGEEDVVAALNLGADDYIVKPFSAREAAARVGAVLRARRGAARRTEVKYEDLVLDAAANRVTAAGRPLKLRGVEYRLLAFLMSHPGRAFRRDQLLARVWGDAAEVDERTVDVNVQRLRKLLAGPGYEAYIQTVRGFGYRFGPPLGFSPSERR